MIELITDSTSDISPALAEQLGVRVLPLSVHFGDESFRDGLDITNADFYARLRAAETLPTTSQINPEVFADAFQEAIDRGNQVVGIFVSSELSGTFQSAVIARGMVDEENVFAVDSRGIAFSLSLLVVEAARMRDAGFGAAEIAQEIERLRGKLRLYAVVDTLKYLKMGGRISAATAVVGGVLGISPIIALEEGKVASVGKARGRKAGVKWIRDRAEEEEIDLSRPVAIGHTDCQEAMDAVEAVFADMLECVPAVYRGEIGAVVGTHAGPGAAGIGYFVK